MIRAGRFFVGEMEFIAIAAWNAIIIILTVNSIEPRASSFFYIKSA